MFAALYVDEEGVGGMRGVPQAHDGYTWFESEHGIYIDHNGFVWTGTSGGTHVMKFTQDGKHVLTIGEPNVNKGSNDPDHLGGPANFYVEPQTNEIFIADGYDNRRVVVYDAATGQYKRHWGRLR